MIERKKILEEILKACCEVHDVTMDEAKGKSKERRIVYCRVCYYLAAKLIVEEASQSLIASFVNRGQSDVSKQSQIKMIEILYGNREFALLYRNTLKKLGIQEV